MQLHGSAHMHRQKDYSCRRRLIAMATTLHISCNGTSLYTYIPVMEILKYFSFLWCLDSAQQYKIQHKHFLSQRVGDKRMTKLSGSSDANRSIQGVAPHMPLQKWYQLRWLSIPSLRVIIAGVVKSALALAFLWFIVISLGILRQIWWLMYMFYSRTTYDHWSAYVKAKRTRVKRWQGQKVGRAYVFVTSSVPEPDGRKLE